jgi:thiol-disulfide isomerase/thioredoxin
MAHVREEYDMKDSTVFRRPSLAASILDPGLLRRSSRVVALVLLLGLAGLTALVASGPPIFGFKPVGYLFELNGQQLENAEVFQSQTSGAFLVLAPDLGSPVLILLRDGRVETLNLMKVNRNSNGTVDVLSGASLAPQGGFQVNGDQTGIAFTIDGQAAELKEKPPLLGLQDAEVLKSYDPHYLTASADYTPSGPVVEKLRQQQRQVEVSVYFGTWCSACKQMVPRIIKVADQLEGSQIHFGFYGLPRGINSDPEAARVGITGVPTGVVYVDGKEAGRISGNGWRVPELAINNLLVDDES